MELTIAFATEKVDAKKIKTLSGREITAAEIDEFIKAQIDSLGIPGMSIAIINDAEIVYHRTLGVTNVDTKENVTDETLFDAGSMSKTLFAFLVMKMVEKGIINLDQPLYTYLPYPDISYDERYKLITARMVLCHTSGFPNWRIMNADQKLDIKFTPGTQFLYSGEGFEYLRHALENKLKTSLEKLTDSLISKPLGMKDTHQSWDSTMDESRFALWHDNEENIFEMPYKTSVNAAANLLTTVEDYCKFGSYVMEGAGISPVLFNDMITPHSNIQKHSAAGLGWFNIKGLPNGEYAIYHLGGSPGVKTIAVFLPKSKCGVVIFTNGDNGINVYKNVIKEVLEAGDSIYEYMWERPDMPKIIDVPDEIIKKYPGHYQYPDVEIASKREKEITISLKGLPKLNLYPETENIFFAGEYPIKVEFVKDDAGLVTKLIFYFEGKKAFEAKKVK